jgi:hypothetical protein
MSLDTFAQKYGDLKFIPGTSQQAKQKKVAAHVLAANYNDLPQYGGADWPPLPDFETAKPFLRQLGAQLSLAEAVIMWSQREEPLHLIVYELLKHLLALQVSIRQRAHAEVQL